MSETLTTGDFQFIVSIKLLSRGAVRAFADLTVFTPLGDLTIPGLRVIQKEGKKPWVSFKFGVRQENGEFKDRQLLIMSPRLEDEIAKLVIRQYQEEWQVFSDFQVVLKGSDPWKGVTASRQVRRGEDVPPCRSPQKRTLRGGGGRGK